MESINCVTIGNTVRIKRSDERNLEMEIKKVVKSHPNAHQKVYKENEKWVFQGFYSTLQDALVRVLDERIATAVDSKSVKNIQNLLDVVESTKEEILTAVKDSGITLENFKRQTDGRGRKAGVSVTVAKIKDVSPKKVSKPRATKKSAKKPAKKLVKRRMGRK